MLVLRILFKHLALNHVISHLHHSLATYNHTRIISKTEKIHTRIIKGTLYFKKWQLSPFSQCPFLASSFDPTFVGISNFHVCHTTPTIATLMNRKSIHPSKYLILRSVLITVISPLQYKITGVSKYSKLSPWKADQHIPLQVVIINHLSSLYLWWIKWISFWNFYFQHKGPSFIRRLWRSSYFSF